MCLVVPFLISWELVLEELTPEAILGYAFLHHEPAYVKSKEAPGQNLEKCTVAFDEVP